MNDEQLLRYSRHLLLTELGVEGQARLAAAQVLIVGAGGLGCPAALYLASGGVGRLTIADPDVVDATNLQRQILYRAESIGAAKAESARAALQAVNPDVEVLPLTKRLAGAALEQAVDAADVVLDCSDNFETRHAVNRACLRAARPLVSGAAIRFDGQLAVFDPRRPGAACYACLFPEDTQAEELRCAVMGVLAPLTGVIGAMQAIEAMKLITGIGEPLSGRLLLLDALHGESRTVRITKDPRCPVCASPSARSAGPAAR
ncbi:MAG: molybdopterin biosynthesis protein MoeB [Betaproteobacteria bacterium SG8_39]|nr:MAG: molybdopterin biosynthesis protein MoeB [Betaproteobacteria bacterium SG8_39]